MIEPLTCREQLPPGAEGRLGSDLYVATDRFRATLRHPESALTIAHVGGLSLLDLAVWDGQDRLHEAVPLVRGGWLDVEDWSIDGDTVRVSGTVASLPDRPAEGEGEEATVRWRFDGPRIEAEGAEGFYLHPRGLVDRDAEAFAASDLVLRDGGATVDLGGAVRTAYPSLLVDRADLAWAHGDDLVEVTLGTNELELQRDGVVVGRVLTAPGQDRVSVERVHAVRAVQAGRAPGPWVPLDGPAVDAPAGPRGTIDLVLPGERGALVHWAADDGRTGTRTLGAGGGPLGLGPGIFVLELPADPRRAAWQTTVEVPEDEALEVVVPPRGAPVDDRWALLAIGAPSDRNRTFRGTDSEAVRRVHASGADAAAFLVEDGTTEIDPEAVANLPLRAHGGLVRRGDGPDGPWEVAAWPIAPNTRKNALGVFGAPTDDPLDAFVAAWGGQGELRHVQVDLPTLAALGPAHTLPALPDLVRLEAPDADLGNWSPWLERLAEGRRIAPTADVTWVPVGDRRRLSIQEVDQALFAGTTCAGNGPRLTLRRERGMLVAERRDGGDGQLEVWTDAGRHATGPAPTLRLPMPTEARWALAVVREGEAWAVAAPLWLVDPVTGEAIGTPPNPSSLR